MATPKKATGTAPVYDNEPGQPEQFLSLDQLPAAPEMDEDEINLSNVLADLGGESDAKVNVYRKLQGKADEFVATYSPAAFSLEDLQVNYGGGQYHVQVRANGRLVTRRIVNIAQPIRPVVPAVSPAVETEKILSTMQNGFQEMSRMLLESVKAIVQNQQPQKTTSDMLNELLLMKQVLGNDAPRTDPVDTLMKNFELFKTLNPSDREPGAMDAILEGLKTLGPVLAQGIQQPRPNMSAPVPVPPQPLPNPTPAPQPQPPVIEQENDPMKFAQTMYINLLVQNAKADPDLERCETYANLLLDTLGDDAAVEVLNMPDWFERLTGINPEAVNYRPWFEEVRRIALEELTDIEKDDKKDASHSPDLSAHANQQPDPVEGAVEVLPVGNS